MTVTRTTTIRPPVCSSRSTLMSLWLPSLYSSFAAVVVSVSSDHFAAVANRRSKGQHRYESERVRRRRRKKTISEGQTNGSNKPSLSLLSKCCAGITTRQIGANDC